MRGWLRDQVEVWRLLRELKYRLAPPLHALKFKLTATPELRAEVERIDLPIFTCPDYHLIPKVPDAGKIVGGALVMHNGVKTLPSSYYGYSNLRYFQKTGGVHEPQEERVFGEVLKRLPADATMLELGAYWGFYSLWFKQVVTGGRAFLVEPLLSNLNYGKKNFALNGFKGDFTRAFVGRTAGTVDGVPQICVDDFLAEHQINRLDVLHSDIQGFELDMLHGAEKSLAADKVDYLFISTHSNDLHRDCTRFLTDRGFVVLTSVDLDDSFSPDGVLVARRGSLTNGLGPITVSLKRQIQPTA